MLWGWRKIWFCVQSQGFFDSPAPKWFRDRVPQVCRYFLLQLGAWMPLKQRARLPLRAFVGLHREVDAGILGREPELERPLFKHSPRNQWVWFTATVILAHLWCGTDVRSLGATCRRCLWKASEASMSWASPFCLAQLSLSSVEVISAGVSCSPQQWQISSFSGLAERGTGKDGTVSIANAGLRMRPLFVLANPQC